MAKDITKPKHRFPLRQIRFFFRSLRKNWPILALFVTTLTLSFLNYEPATFLTGWDNLHPEFNLPLAFKRVFSSVWLEYRGPGLLAGMAEGADLPRLLFVSLLTLIGTPLSLIRYLVTFSHLFLGPLGVYFLLNRHFFKNRIDYQSSRTASFFGALFYLLNLNTIQTFFVPFETFTSFYAFLPFLLYFLFSFQSKPSLKNFLLLYLISFLSAPSFYVETLFIVFGLFIAPFILKHLFKKSPLKSKVSLFFKSFIALVFPHLFWLIPIAFFALTSGNIPQEAKNNLLSSPETYARNLEFANFKDTALLRGYLFNYLDLGPDGKYTYLLSVWRNHQSIPLINLIGFITFVIILFGVYYSLKKKLQHSRPLIFSTLICLFFLLGGGLLLNRQIPLIGELFRSPFTKFSTPLALSYSFFFAVGTVFILDLFTFLHTKLTHLLTLFTLSLLLVISASPAFSGHLISSTLKRSIPSEYFQLFQYLNSQNHSGRIASFPQFSFWGWSNYSWGYRGSGFLWYGVPQPLLDRAFDSWSKNSEKYYEEISRALYSKEQNYFISVLKKYAVSDILLDENIILPENANDEGISTLKSFLETPIFQKTASFGDKIHLYHFKQTSADPAIALTSPSTAIKPFASLSLRPNTNWIEKGGYLNYSASLPSGNLPLTLNLPSITNSEKLLPYKIEYRKSKNSLDLRFSPILPVIFASSKQINLPSPENIVSIPNVQDSGFILGIDGNYIEMQLPSEIQTSTFYPLTELHLPTLTTLNLALYQNSPTLTTSLINTLSENTPTQCYQFKPNRKVEKIITPNGISLIGTDVVGCLSAPLPSIAKNNLLSISFNYSSPTLTTANANISGQDRLAISPQQPFEPKSNPTPARIFAPSTGQFQQLNLLLEAGESNSLKEIVYQNPTLLVHPLIHQSTLLLKSIPDISIPLEANQKTIQISLPQINTSLSSTQISSSNSLYPENLNCDRFNKGTTIKQKTDSGFLYQSKNAIECDYLNLPHLPHDISYILGFDLDHRRGLTPTICLENHRTRRCDVQERLLDTNTTQYVIQNITAPQTKGYTLHIYNQSLGDNLTSNLLKRLTITPLPLSFIENISLIDQSPPPAPSGTITRHDQFLTFIHRVQTKQENPQTLNLYQSDDRFWSAFKISSKDQNTPLPLFSALLPFSLPVLEKLPLSQNNWHLSINLTENENNLAFVYLPAYLQYLGLLLTLSVPLIYLALTKYQKARKTTKKAPKLG